MQETRGLVGTVDIQGQIAGAIEIHHGDPVGHQPVFGGLLARDRNLDALPDTRQGLDEQRDGAARTDPDHAPIFDVVERGLGGAPLVPSWFMVLACGLPVLSYGRCEPRDADRS